MAGWNGSGTFSRTHDWTDDQGNGIKIRADRHDTNDVDFVNGINNCVTKDGQNSATANLPMGGFRHTGVDDGAARDDYLAVGQFQDGAVIYGTSGGSSNAYTLTPSPVITAYAAGQRFRFKANHLSTGAATLNVNGVGAKNIKLEGFWDLAPYAIKTDQVIEVIYDGTQFQPHNMDAVTGDIQMWSSATVKPGWLQLDGSTTIGSASSGADNAAAVYEGLWKHLYDATDDAEAAVSGGRTTRDADWTANKTLTLPETDDFGPYGIGTTLTKAFKTAGALTVTSTGSITGSVTGYALVEGDLPSSLTVTVTTGNVDDAASDGFATANSTGAGTMSQSLTSVGSSNTHTHDDTFAYSGDATSVQQPSFGTYFIIKI